MHPEPAWLKLLQGAQTAFRSKDFTLAETLGRKVLACKPDCVQAMLILSALFLEGGQLQSALEMARSAQRVRQDGATLFCVGMCHERLGNQGEAEFALKRALAIEPNSAQILRSLGGLLTKMGKREEAAPLLRRALQIEPDSAHAHVAAACALTEIESAEEIEALLRKAIALDPGLETAYSGLAAHFLVLGRFAEAADSFEQAIAINPSNGILYEGLTKCKRFKDEDRPAIDRMERALSGGELSESAERDIHFALGKAYDDLGEYAKAMPHFHAGQKIAKAAGGTTFDLRSLQDEFDKAIGLYSKGYVRENRRLGQDLGRPIFVVGMMRSGTTLVEQVLASHSDVASGGELSYWTAWRGDSLEPTGKGIVSSDLEIIAQGYVDVLRGIDGDRKHITDKMPYNFRSLGAIHLCFPDSPIVHCRRNPADTCLSIYLTPHIIADFAHDPADIAAFYKEYERLMAHWRTTLPEERLFEIDYEELVHDKERVTKRIIAFCGLPWEEACLSHERRAGLIATPSVWQARQPIFSSSVGRWRNYEPWLEAFKELQEERTP